MKVLFFVQNDYQNINVRRVEFVVTELQTLVLRPMVKPIFFEKTKTRFSNGSLFVITRSPEQYNDGLNSEEKVRNLSEYEGTVVVFDDVINHNQKN